MSDEPTTAIAEYSPTAAALADIASRMAKVVYDVSTPEGMAAARKDRAEVRDLRVALEHKRKEIKAPALKRCDEIDTEAKRITAELLKYEEPPDRAIKAEEKRLEDLRQAKIKAEQERQAAIQRRIAAFGNTLVLVSSQHMSAERLAKYVDDTEAVAIDDSFGDSKETAQQAKDAALVALRKIYDSAVARETEDARLAEERAKLQRERAEQEEANRKERERVAAQEAEARRIREAEEKAQREERERVAAEQRAESERIRLERVKLEADQKAEAMRKENEARAQREAEAAAEREREAERKRNCRPTFDEIVDVVAKHYDREAGVVREWISDASGALPAKKTRSAA